MKGESFRCGSKVKTHFHIVGASRECTLQAHVSVSGKSYNEARITAALSCTALVGCVTNVHTHAYVTCARVRACACVCVHACERVAYERYKRKMWNVERGKAGRTRITRVTHRTTLRGQSLECIVWWWRFLKVKMIRKSYFDMRWWMQGYYIRYNNINTGMLRWDTMM
jgi:hypothetical protein